MVLKKRSEEGGRLQSRLDAEAYRIRKRHLRKMQVGFCPPEPNLFAIGAFKVMRNIIVRIAYGVTEVDVEEADIAVLLSRMEKPLLIVPNHPSKADPAIMFCLSALTQGHFLYVSNREQFKGVYGKLLQCLGAYSLVRGMRDKESFATTIKALQTDVTPVVIFAEGGRYSTADQVAPPLDGVFALARLAWREQVKRNSDYDLTILPVAITYVHDLQSDSLDQALDRLEIAVGAERRLDGKLVDRIRSVSERIVHSNEVALRIEPNEGARLADRCQRIIEWELIRISQELGCDVSKASTTQDRIRELQNHFANAICGEPQLISSYDERLFKSAFERRRATRMEIERLERWSHIRPGTIEKAESEEACVDLIHRLELEVFGKIKLNLRKRAVVRISEPLSLRDSSEERLKARNLATEVQRRIQELIDGLKE